MPYRKGVQYDLVEGPVTRLLDLAFGFQSKSQNGQWAAMREATANGNPDIHAENERLRKDAVRKARRQNLIDRKRWDDNLEEFATIAQRNRQSDTAKKALGLIGKKEGRNFVTLLHTFGNGKLPKGAEKLTRPKAWGVRSLAALRPRAYAWGLNAGA